MRKIFMIILGITAFISSVPLQIIINHYLAENYSYFVTGGYGEAFTFHQVVIAAGQMMLGAGLIIFAFHEE